MKLKSILLTAVATISLVTATMAQVPNYVPTNGLVGWWPFNGNANDESGNGNNGTVNGATLTTDRFGNPNKAFDFNGSSSFINVPNSSSLQFNGGLTISVWVRPTNLPSPLSYILSKGADGGTPNSWCFTTGGTPQNRPNLTVYDNGAALIAEGVASNQPLILNNWVNLIFSFDGTNAKCYINGVFEASSPTTYNVFSNIYDLKFGRRHVTGLPYFFTGKMDDFGLWNRALTQQEITALYNATNCANNTTITPQTNSLSTGSTATFIASTSDPNPSYVWQSNFGQGFQTLNNFGNYSGANSSTLNIANIQLSEHNQPIRVITQSGNCIDTSNVGIIKIVDTCSVTVYDTLFTSVTDTLIINATLTGLNPPSNLNTLKVYPNPANTHITIDYGNFASMSGYTLKITNNLGQVVFTSPINQQSSYIDLSTWTGNGIYFVQIIDTQNNTIENRKIVLQ